MTEILYAGSIPLDAMPQIISACHFEQDALFLAEHIPTYPLVTQKARRDLDLLRFTRVKEGTPYAKYTSGRIFQEDREFRWEKQKTLLRVVYLGPEDSNAESIFHRHELKHKKNVLAALEKSTESTYYSLFGERLKADDLRHFGETAQAGDFAVVRIPRVLRYPVCLNDEPAVRLLVQEYHNEATGSIDLFRFQALETWNDRKRGESV